MNATEIRIAILVAAGVSLVVRALPLTLIRRQIRNRFIRSFLFYVPYVTLAVMTFPAMIDAAAHPGAGIAALGAGAAAAWLGAGLFPVAVISCAVEFLAGLI
jgi:branched-subunit amino acid transport protein